MKHFLMIPLVLAFLAIGFNVSAQEGVTTTQNANVTTTQNANVTKASADDKVAHTEKKSDCAGKAKGGKSCCAKKASGSASADATMMSDKDGTAKKSCCAEGKKMDCHKGKASKEEDSKDI